MGGVDGEEDSDVIALCDIITESARLSCSVTLFRWQKLMEKRQMLPTPYIPSQGVKGCRMQQRLVAL